MLFPAQPSFSMGSKFESSKSKLKSPGPGQYENLDKHKTVLSNAANYSFTRDERANSKDNVKKLQKTGPGSYDPYRGSA